MITIRIDVQRSGNMEDADRYVTVRLPGVPRIGETVFAENEMFTVNDVTWSEEDVSITVESVTYGYPFMIPKRK